MLWVLPDDRPGYRAYRELVEKWLVCARGRRGEGNYILAAPDELIDVASPLPQVIAYGVVETPTTQLAVTVRERLGDQIDFEIVNLRGGETPSVNGVTRRWTYSSWLPSQPCPICAGLLREVEMKTEHEYRLVLAVCAKDQRMWVYDTGTGINHPIPVTNYYNELMLQKNIRDPKIALDFKRLFLDLAAYSDYDLARAFITYNNIRTKITIEEQIVVREKHKSILQRLVSLFNN
jgi:hypothetical protein